VCKGNLFTVFAGYQNLFIFALKIQVMIFNIDIETMPLPKLRHLQNERLRQGHGNSI
jgi:hypothetical protein